MRQQAGVVVLLPDNASPTTKKRASDTVAHPLALKLMRGVSLA